MEATVIQGMNDRLIKIGQFYGTEESVEKEDMEIMIDHRQQKNVEYFNYLGSMIINDAKCTREIKSRTDMAKRNMQQEDVIHRVNGLKFMEEIMKMLHSE
jgi:hypothetical protein